MSLIDKIKKDNDLKPFFLEYLKYRLISESINDPILNDKKDIQFYREGVERSVICTYIKLAMSLNLLYDLDIEDLHCSHPTHILIAYICEYYRTKIPLKQILKH